MNAALPIVSVLMPVYNAERYLPAALESILAQTFRDFELVVVDDGSTDRSPAILQKYAMRDARIRIISRPNTGIVGALNDGITAVRGQYIARMDGDDLALPQRLERQVAYLNEHPDCVIVGSAASIIDPWGQELTVCGANSAGPLGVPDCPVSRVLDVGTFLLHPAVMMRTDDVRAIGGYRPEYEWLEDVDLYLRLARRGRVHCLPDVLLQYRLHLTSVSRTKVQKQAVLRIQLAREILAERGLSDEAITVVEERVQREMQQPFDPRQRETELLRTWSWLALNSGNWRVARRHAFAALRRRPWDGPCWWTMLNATLGQRATQRIMNCRKKISRPALARPSTQGARS